MAGGTDGGSVEQALRKARQYRRQGGRAQAVAVLSDLVRRYPGNRRARARCARSTPPRRQPMS
ncbi:MAG: hypothetical protein JKP98_16855 [Rhodobacteraceae bacterium]|nr:hypothetical protein [Paracoccaceae bacterium]